MNTDLLREAAREIRVDVSSTDLWDFDTWPFALAVADWLETTAADVGTSSLAFHAALAAAHAYFSIGENA